MTCVSKMHYVSSVPVLIEKFLDNVEEFGDHEKNIQLIHKIATDNKGLNNVQPFDYMNYMYNYISNCHEYYNENTKKFDVDKICYNWITVGYVNKLKMLPCKFSDTLVHDYINSKNKVAIITSFNKTLLEKYAKYFLKSINFSFDLYISHEDNLCMVDLQKYTTKTNVSLYSLLDDPSLHEFILRNKEKNEVEKVENFLRDAIRFSYKVFTMCNLYKRLKDKYTHLIWIDADMIFKEESCLTFNNLKEFIKDETMMSYLSRMTGKHKQYSECGFLVFNTKHEYTEKFLETMKYMYTSDLIYKESEVHDSWIWDIVRIKFENEHNVTNYPIPNDGKYHISKGNVLLHSELCNYMMHPKGEDFKKSLTKFIKYTNKKNLRVNKYDTFRLSLKK